MKKFIPIAISAIVSIQAPAYADPKAAVIDELAGHLEFVDYGRVTIFAEHLLARRLLFGKSMIGRC